MDTLFEIMEQLKDKYISCWHDICKFETNSRDKEDINKLNDFIEEFAEKDGFEVERIPFENAGDYMIIDMNKGAEKGYMFLAHTDTVFEKGVFGKDVVKIENDKMYGPGVIDCKGGIAIALMIMKALTELEYDKNLRLILVSDEEVDNSLSVTGADVIKKYAEGYNGAFCCEVGKDGEVLIGRKGILRYQVKVKGKSAHSGIDYFKGVNAIYEASKKIIALQELSIVDGPTYSCNVINAGTVFNIIPDECSFYVDIRFKNYDEKEEAVKNIENIANTDFIGNTYCELIKLSERDPMVCTEDNKLLFKKVKQVADKYNLEDLHPAENGGGSDAAYTVAVGVPTLCGIGATGDFCHTVNEYANISSLASRAKMIGEVILNN